MSEPRERTVVVVGAGAAGLMAAVSAAREGARTILLDRRRKVGAKILVSGGTRCNRDERRVRPEDFNTPSLPFVRNVLRELSPEAARRFFEEHGVALKLEPTGKYFPVSDSARDVLAGLLRACDAAGVELRREADVTEVATDGETFRVASSAGEVEAAAVVVCTGGLSMPETGSDGAGYGFASAFGHRVVPTSPALTPLVARPAPHAGLSGVSLDATLSVVANGRVVVERTGSLLFTHTGYSGPVAMDVSRHWIRHGWEAADVAVRAAFVPGRDAASLEAEWLSATTRAPKRRVASLLSAWLPNRLADDVAERAGVRETTLGAATRDARRRTIAEVAAATLPVTGVAGYAKAEVTAGGVALDEVVARTLESKLRPGLFFAGEVLDVDGYIGGFNFQWAWSSGWVAGRAAARRAASLRA